MKIKKTPVIWTSLSLLTLILLCVIAWQYAEPREIKLSQQQAQSIGEKIWRNKKPEGLIVWNKGEEAPLLGIGRFKWYPKDIKRTQQNDFLALLIEIEKYREIPAWLKNQTFPPWQSREAFIINEHDIKTQKLRTFLRETLAEQVRLSARQLEADLPLIIKEIKNPFSKRHVRENFYQLVNNQNGVYPLIDYANFMGNGTSPSERYNNLGWGLAQVLEHMPEKTPNPLATFANAAEEMLIRRVQNSPIGDNPSLEQWIRRLHTYEQR